MRLGYVWMSFDQYTHNTFYSFSIYIFSLGCFDLNSFTSYKKIKKESVGLDGSNEPPCCTEYTTKMHYISEIFYFFFKFSLISKIRAHFFFSFILQKRLILFLLLMT